MVLTLKRFNLLTRDRIAGTCLTLLLLATSAEVLAHTGHGDEFHQNQSAQSAGAIEVDTATAERISLKIEPVTRQSLAFGVQATGQIEASPSRRVEVTNPVGGTVVRLLVEPGDTVEAGQPLAVIYLFKQDLQALVNELGIEIRIAHYPPYTSKYNPIEHRLFPHLTRVCQGVIFQSVEVVCELMAKAKTKTKTGLKVFATVLDKVYETGRKVTQEFRTFLEKKIPIFEKRVRLRRALFSKMG